MCILTATLSGIGDGEIVVALPADSAPQLAEVAVGPAVGAAYRSLRLGPRLPALGPTDALGHAPSEDAAASLRAAHPLAAGPAGVALDAAAEHLPEEERPVVVVLLAVGRRRGDVGAPAALLLRHALREDLLAAARAVDV